jgi:diadenosine tetraphosphate (Ap4A) HIT family hydrolase
VTYGFQKVEGSQEKMTRTSATDWCRFDLPLLAVGSTPSWILSVRPAQRTLGSCLILNQNRVTEFSQVSERDVLELRIVIRAFEQLAKACFNPARFNYVISGQHDPLLHLHAFPRYSQEVPFGRKTWVDDRWPMFLTFPELESEPADVLSAIVTVLRQGNRAHGLLAEWEDDTHS